MKTRIFILKKLKYSRYTTCTQLVQLASWEQDPRSGFLREQIHDECIGSAGMGGTEQLRGRSAAVPLSSPFAYHNAFLGNRVPGTLFQEWRWRGKNLTLPWRDSVLWNIVTGGLNPSTWSHALSFHSGMANIIITYPFFKGKHLLYSGHFQRLEILGAETLIKRAGPRENFFQSPPAHVSRAPIEFLCLNTTPTHVGRGANGVDLAWDTWQCQLLLPPHPYFATLQIDVCTWKLSWWQKYVPTLGLNSQSLKQGRALKIIVLPGIC